MSVATRMTRPRLVWLPVILACLIAAGCAGKPSAPPGGADPGADPADYSGDDLPDAAASGGYYGGDRPPESIPVDPDSVADAVPQRAPLSATGNRPYTALGKRYVPLASARGYVQRGMASWYGSKFQGRRTSGGEAYDMFAMTAAHPVLPLPSWVRVTNLDNGSSVVVKVNDRGPFLHGRIIDLSYMAALKLGIAAPGTGRVEVRAIEPGDDSPAYSADDPADSGGVGGGADSGETILIQVGAYANPGNARAIRQRLERAGYPVTPWPGDAAPQPAQAPAQTLYRVRVGPFTSRERARTVREELETMLGRPVAVVAQ